MSSARRHPGFVAVAVVVTLGTFFWCALAIAQLLQVCIVPTSFTPLEVAVDRVTTIFG